MPVSGNETKLEDVVKEMKGEIEKVVIESKEMKDEISGVKNETKRVLDVLENVVNASKITASNQHNAEEEVSLRHLQIPEYMRFRAKRVQISALYCEYQRLLSVKNYSTNSTLVSAFSVK